jgi:iron complex outermembrane receptor protein
MPAEGKSIKRSAIPTTSFFETLCVKLNVQKMKKLRMKQMTAALLLSLATVTVVAQRATVSGTITGEDGLPLPGAAVVAVGTLGGTAAGIDGRYLLTLGRDGTYEIRVSFIGYRPVTATVEVRGSVTADFEMQPVAIPAAEVVVSATRAGNRTPVTYNTISGEELKRSNFGADIPFLLSMTPSLVETSEAGNGIGYTAMRIRGSDASRINVTIDGIPLNDAESQQVFWVDLPDFASSVESIQVQRGAGTSGNGAGAFGASVNMQTVSPGAEPVASVMTGLGSFNTFKQSAVAGTGTIRDRVSLLMRYSGLRSDGYVRHSGSDHRSMYVTGVYTAGRSRLKANVIIGEEQTGISWYGVTPEMMESDRRYNPAGVYTDAGGVERYYENQTDNYWQNHYHLIFSRNMGRGLLLHTAAHLTDGKGYYEQYKEDRRLSEFGLPPVEIGGEVFSRSDVIHRKWNDIRFYGVTWALKYDGGGTDAAIGGAVNRHDGDHFGRMIWMQYPGDTESGYEWYINNAVKDEFNIYGKVNRMLLPRLSAYADMQMRLIAYRMAGPDDNLLLLDQEHLFRFFNPKAGLYFTPAPGHDLYASRAVAHREPTRANYKDAVGDDQATPRPERLIDLEAGYSLRSATASLNVNLYYMLYRDQLVPTGELSNVGYPIMTNVSDSYRAGIEFVTALRPVEFLEWNMTITLSRNKIRDFVEYYIDYNTSDWSEEYRSRELGLVDIAYSPSVTGASELVVRPFPAAELRLSGKYVGSQYFDNTMSDARKLDPYFVSNAVASYRFAFRGMKEAVVSLAVNNLFNSMYVSNAYGGNWYEDGDEQTWHITFPRPV